MTDLKITRRRAHTIYQGKIVDGTLISSEYGYLSFFVVDESKDAAPHELFYVNVIISEEVCPACAHATIEQVGAVMMSKETLAGLLGALGPAVEIP